MQNITWNVHGTHVDVYTPLMHKINTEYKTLLKLGRFLRHLNALYPTSLFFLVELAIFLFPMRRKKDKLCTSAFQLSSAVKNIPIVLFKIVLRRRCELKILVCLLIGRGTVKQYLRQLYIYKNEL